MIDRGCVLARGPTPLVGCPGSNSIVKILLAEDDPELARQIDHCLRDAGHLPSWHSDGETARAAALASRFDILILDVNLPSVDGFQLVEHLRAAGKHVPVLFLTARDSVVDRVRGLKAGGDDYLTKPFAMEELLARLDALGRRANSVSAQSSAPRKVGVWTLEPIHRRLHSAEASIELQPKEWTLLEVLLSSGDRVFTKKYLLEKVWDIQFDPGTNVVDAMVCKLRRKIDKPGAPSHIQTVRGKGYAFKNIP
jgi:DNA-binding response OmpR family regulator